jgi:hypothetical protein
MTNTGAKLTKPELRARGWSHKQIKDQPNDGSIKTGCPGRPAFTYSLEAVKAAEAGRS